jgi:hypothetical protein
MKKSFMAVTAFGFALVPAQALAQQTPGAEPTAPYLQERVATPEKAFELTIDTGYTQGLGQLQGGVNMASVASPGIAFDLGAGYRINPNWAVSVNGQYHELTPERAAGARGFAPNVAVAYHITPEYRADPWVQLGTGYRMLWETHDNAPTVLTHGFELAKLTVGLDVRVSEDVALAPVIGADLNLPLWQSGATNIAIVDPRLNTFLFGGIQGRFDMAGERTTEKVTTVARQ